MRVGTSAVLLRAEMALCALTLLLIAIFHLIDHQECQSHMAPSVVRSLYSCQRPWESGSKGFMFLPCSIFMCLVSLESVFGFHIGLCNPSSEFLMQEIDAFLAHISSSH